MGTTSAPDAITSRGYHAQSVMQQAEAGRHALSAHILYWKKYSKTWDEALTDALAEIGSVKTDLIISDCDAVFSSAHTIPNNIRLVFGIGGLITGVITINGPIDAGPWQIFGPTSTITISQSTNEFSRPEWWYPGSGVHRAAIQAAMDACFRVQLLAIKYTIDGVLEYDRDRQYLVGTAYGRSNITPGTTIVLADNSDTKMLQKKSGAGNLIQLVFENLSFDGNKINQAVDNRILDFDTMIALQLHRVRVVNAGEHGIYCKTVQDSTFTGLRSTSNWGTNLYLEDCSGLSVRDSQFENGLWNFILDGCSKVSMVGFKSERGGITTSTTVGKPGNKTQECQIINGTQDCFIQWVTKSGRQTIYVADDCYRNTLIMPFYLFPSSQQVNGPNNILRGLSNISEGLEESLSRQPLKSEFGDDMDMNLDHTNSWTLTGSGLIQKRDGIDGGMQNFERSLVVRKNDGEATGSVTVHQDFTLAAGDYYFEAWVGDPNGDTVQAEVIEDPTGTPATLIDKTDTTTENTSDSDFSSRAIRPGIIDGCFSLSGSATVRIQFTVGGDSLSARWMVIGNVAIKSNKVQNGDFETFSGGFTNWTEVDADVVLTVAQETTNHYTGSQCAKFTATQGSAENGIRTDQKFGEMCTVGNTYLLSCRVRLDAATAAAWIAEAVKSENSSYGISTPLIKSIKTSGADLSKRIYEDGGIGSQQAIGMVSTVWDDGWLRLSLVFKPGDNMLTVGGDSKYLHLSGRNAITSQSLVLLWDDVSIVQINRPRQLAFTAAETLSYQAHKDLTISNEGAVGIVTLTLPAGEDNIGGRFSFVRSVTQTFRIDPDGTETIQGGGAGKYLELDTDGDSVTLEWINNLWEIMAINGTVAYEA